MLPLPLSTLLITHLMKILMFLRALSDQLPKVLEATARTRSVLTVRNRSWSGVGNEADKVARPVAVDSATVAGHQFHAYVAEEGNQVCHAPGSCPLWSG